MEDRYVPISKIFAFGRSMLQKRIPFILERESYLGIIFADKIRNNSYVLCIQLITGFYSPLSLEGGDAIAWGVFSSNRGKDYFIELFNNIVFYTGYDVSITSRPNISHSAFDHCLEVLGLEPRTAQVMVKLKFAGSTVFYFESDGMRYGFILGEKESYFCHGELSTYEQRILYAYVMSKLWK